MDKGVQQAMGVLKSFGFERRELTGLLVKIHGIDSCVFEKNGVNIITKIDGFADGFTDENITRHIVNEVVNGYTKHLLR